MTATNDYKSLIDDIRRAVKDTLVEGEEKATLLKVEDTLAKAKATIDELTESLVVKGEEMASLTGEKDKLLNQLTEAQKKIEELQAALLEGKQLVDELTERASLAESALDKVQREKLRMERLTELKDAGLLVEDEAVMPTFIGQVMAMSAEDFSAYKAEMSTLKEKLIAKANATAEADKEALKATASLDVELKTETTSDKYKKFGEGIAALLRDERGKATR